MLKTIFAGSSEFGLVALARLRDAVSELLVVSQPDRPSGRRLRPQPCPVAAYASQHGLDLFQPQDINAPGSLQVIRNFGPQLIVTASYGGLLRRELRRLPGCGTLNLHPSLLPQYRGATPIQSALLEGAERTGVSIFRLSARLDAGPIYSQAALDIDTDDNFSTLQDKLAALAADLLLVLLPRLERGEAEARAQDQSQATHTAKFGPSDLQLDFAQPAVQVRNRIRAFALTPGAHTCWRGRQLKILAARLTGKLANGKPGTLAAERDPLGFRVNCADTQLLITLVQPAGKHIMPAPDFARGARFAPAEGFGTQLPQPPA